jgi:DNA-binding NarL/FixJ family response regulator
MKKNSIHSGDKELRAILAHSTRLVREGIANLLHGDGFELVTEVDNENDLVRLTASYNPDILMLDWALSESPANIINLLSEQKHFKGAIVLIGTPESPDRIVEVVRAGARGCLSLDLPGEAFLSRLRLLSQGDFLVSRDLTPGLSQQWEAGTPDETTDGLSNREREVLALVSTGATNKEIAQELIVTENTVKVHLRHILDKLDLRNRQQLAVYAVREGLAREDSATEYAQSG